MLKRLLLGAVAFAYLALVGVQAAHYHQHGIHDKPDCCAVCATVRQSVRQAANSAPALAALSRRGVVLSAPRQTLREADLLPASARAPPAGA